jgi:hypothetical protein
VDISSDTFSLLALFLILLLVIGFFIRITVRVRRGGGSLTTIALGATDAFLNKDRRKAAEVIVNQNAGKMLDAQGSEGPNNLDVSDSTFPGWDMSSDINAPRSAGERKTTK